MLFQSADTSKA